MYCFYDYGCLCELYLEVGIVVSELVFYVVLLILGDVGNGCIILCEGGKFVFECWLWSDVWLVKFLLGVFGWLVFVMGGGMIDGVVFFVGECWMVDGVMMIVFDVGSDVLFVYLLKDCV